MNEKELKKLIEKGENETLEFKTSLSDLQRIVEIVCSFANKKGGSILIGVDKEGKVKGIKLGEKTLERLTDTIVDNTDPNVYPEVRSKKVDGQTIIIITIKGNSNKLHTAYGRAFIRVGKNTKLMKQGEYERLLLERRRDKFDSLICEGATVDDIDWAFVEKFFIPRYEALMKRKTTGESKELLEALGCVKDNKPTNAGILLFGKNPQKFFMNAFIALARYKGKVEGIERLDYKEFLGSIFQQIDECDSYIKEHIAIMSRLLPHKVEREDIPEFGWFSLRELTTNAVCHRDYEDQSSKVIIKIFENRIEYYNPGGLPTRITPKNITERQYSRNPIIARVLAKIKYIEELGEGWNKIIEEHKYHPLKPTLPRIKADKYSVLVTLYSTKEKFEKGGLELNERQKKAIDYIRRKDRITNTEYQKINFTTKKTATRDLQDLVKREILLKKGRTGKGVYYVIDPSYRRGDITGHNGT